MRLIIVLAIIAIVACNPHVHRTYKQYDYNKIDHQAFNSYSEFYRQLFTNLVNGQQTASFNIILGVATPECMNVLDDSAPFLGAQRMASHDVLHSVTIPSDGFPLELNGCAEAFFYRIGSTIANPADRTVDFNNQAFTSWSRKITNIGAEFINEFAYPIAISYVGESQEPTPQTILDVGKTFRIGTYLGHIFTARQVTDRSAFPGRLKELPLVDYLIVESETYRFNPRNRLENCVVIEASEFLDNRTVGCDDMELRFADFSMRQWYSKRLGLNFVQPKMVPPASISKYGFELRKLPKRTYSWLRAWYDKERMMGEVVEGSSGPCMNQLVAPSQITHLSSDLKERLADELKPIVQDWYRGTSDLYLTSIYGIRKYTNGSILRMHVDTANTHVVSTIINVDQDVDEDWKLVILDHDDNEHEVSMQPGDLLLYESAKLLHGRPSTFIGKHYDNIFVHYRPNDLWDFKWI